VHIHAAGCDGFAGARLDQAIDAMNGMSPPYGQLRKDYERFPAAGLGSAGTEKDLSQVRVTTPPYSVVAFFLSRSTAL